MLCLCLALSVRVCLFPSPPHFFLFHLFLLPSLPLCLADPDTPIKWTSRLCERKDRTKEKTERMFCQQGNERRSNLSSSLLASWLNVYPCRGVVFFLLPFPVFFSACFHFTVALFSLLKAWTNQLENAKFCHCRKCISEKDCINFLCPLCVLIFVCIQYLKPARSQQGYFKVYVCELFLYDVMLCFKDPVFVSSSGLLPSLGCISYQASSRMQKWPSSPMCASTSSSASTQSCPPPSSTFWAKFQCTTLRSA